jgi:hypothetical protein
MKFINSLVHSANQNYLQAHQIKSMIQVGLGNALSHKTTVLFWDAIEKFVNSQSFEVDIALLNSILKKLCNVDDNVKKTFKFCSQH